MHEIPSWIHSPLPLVPKITLLEKWLANIEKKYAVRGDLASTISFASVKQKPTEYSILYLHGYGASIQETQPLADNIAKQLHANLVSMRLSGHALNISGLEYISAKTWFESALLGLAIAQKLGNEVIVIGNSTGSTLALLLSIRKSAIHEIKYQIVLSPNCYPKERLLCSLLLSPLKRIICLLPTVPLIRSMIPSGDGDNPQHSPHLVYSPISELHEKYQSLRIPTSSLPEMMKLIQILWVAHNKHQSLFCIPTTVIASELDQDVDFKKTQLFFKGYSASHSIHIYNNSSHRNKHVLAGEIFSPESTCEVTKLILKDLKLYVSEHIQVDTIKKRKRKSK